MKRILCMILACVVGLQLAGCATTQDGRSSSVGQGAVAGAVVGGVLGALIGGDRRGAVVGALAGAALGAVIGDYHDRQVASRAEAARRYAVDKQPRLEVENSDNRPARAPPGTTVESQVGYTVLAPGPQDIQVTESRTLVRGQESFPLSKRNVTRTQGTHVSTLKFTLPKDLPPGDYTLVTTVTAGALTRTVQAPLSVA